MKSIRRYSGGPLFQRPRRLTPTRWFILFLMLMATLLVFATWSDYERTRTLALNLIGLGPTPQPLASELATEASARYREGDIESARRLFERAYAAQPGNISYGYEWGRLLLEQGEFTAAATLGEELMAKAPGDVRAYALRARALVLAGEASAAIPIAVSGRAQGPDFAPILGTLARAYADIARYEQAHGFGQQAVALAPNDVDVRRDFAYALLWLGRYNEAIEQLELATRLNPNLLAVQFELAAYYNRVNEVQRAVGVYNHILEREPNNAKAYLRLCQTYSGQGLFAEAQGYCQKAKEIQPIFPQAYSELGRMMYTRRNYEGAIEELETCVSQGGQDIECWYLRGLAHYRLGQCADAWAVLNESLVRAATLSDGGLIIQNILFGLEGITLNCEGYSGRQLPTPIPPTPIPPPPIGSYGSGGN